MNRCKRIGLNQVLPTVTSSIKVSKQRKVLKTSCMLSYKFSLYCKYHQEITPFVPFSVVFFGFSNDDVFADDSVAEVYEIFATLDSADSAIDPFLTLIFLLVCSDMRLNSATKVLPHQALFNSFVSLMQ